MPPTLALPGCIVRPDGDWLFDRIAQRDQGWHIKNDHGDIWPTPSTLDLAIIEAVRSAATHGNKIAVGVPRIVTGIILGPAIYVALNRFIQRTGFADQPGFNAFPFSRHSDRIVLASRSHAVRDLLGASLMKFGRSETKLCQFPTFRLTRTGDLEPGVYGDLPKQERPRSDQMIALAPSLVVYDYWPFPATIRLPRVAAVFAELAEHDSLETVERLKDFTDRTNPAVVLAIVNLNDAEKRQRLAELGYQFVAAQTPEGDGGSLRPSFAAVDLAAPKQTSVTFQPVPDEEPVNKTLAEAFQLIVEAHARVPRGTLYPAALTRAWYILDHLASCPVSLERYETLRRRDPREQTLRFRIGKLREINWGSVPDTIRSMLMLRWPDIVDRLDQAHTLLLESNPKWWAVADRILAAASPTGVIVSNRLAAQALREELLLGFDWNEMDSLVAVRSFREARRNDELFPRVVLLGAWKDLQRPLVFALLPRQIDILGYSYEACVLEKRLHAVQQDLEQVLPDQTRATYTRLLHHGSVTSSPARQTALTWNTDGVRHARNSTIRHWQQMAKAPARGEVDDNDELLIDDELHYEYTQVVELAADHAAATPSYVTPDDADDDELIPAVSITFADSTHVTLPADRELLVLPRDADVAQQRFAANLAVEDRVLLFSSSEHHDIFATTLTRTRHLLATDQRILDRWRDALVTLRHSYPPDEWGSGARFCEALEGLNCRRDRVTMRSWITGSTMAPRDPSDIACMLCLAGVSTGAESWAALIAREINYVRDFNRRIGRRIIRRMLTRGSGDETRDRIDEEIDELLEDSELRVVAAVGPVQPQPARTLTFNATEEEL